MIEDGNTIQVGYGSLPNAILANLGEKKHLGVHTELLGDGLVKLMKSGVIDNSQKTINRGKTIATFSMGSAETYEYLHDNPFIEFKTVDYTNDPRVIAQHENMTAINSALEIDLTGQATAESLGKVFYSGIGGQADFMRGAILAKKEKPFSPYPLLQIMEKCLVLLHFSRREQVLPLIGVMFTMWSLNMALPISMEKILENAPWN